MGFLRSYLLTETLGDFIVHWYAGALTRLTARVFLPRETTQTGLCTLILE